MNFVITSTFLQWQVHQCCWADASQNYNDANYHGPQYVHPWWTSYTSFDCTQWRQYLSQFCFRPAWFSYQLTEEQQWTTVQIQQTGFSFSFGVVWTTIGCLVYILQHSLCVDPGEPSWFPESRICNEPSTHFIFQNSGETNQLFLVRETQNDFTMPLMSRDI